MRIPEHNSQHRFGRTSHVSSLVAEEGNPRKYFISSNNVSPEGIRGRAGEEKKEWRSGFILVQGFFSQQ